MKEFIYTLSFDMARERGETELFRESEAQNRACLAAIDKAISASNYDGRYSSTNKAWAQNVELADRRGIVLNSHPILLDGFADKVREAQLHKW